MKYVLIIAIFTIAATLTFGKTIKEGDTEYQCNPVKTCDEKLKSAYAEIARLKKQLKQSSVVITKTETVETVREVTKIKKHIISVVGHKSVIDVNTKTFTSGTTQVAEGMVETAYIPAIVYQYQFNNGTTPMIGLDINRGSGLVFGLGYEF
jgi:hypothetical protein